MSKRQVTCISSNNLCAATDETLARAACNGLHPVLILVPDRFTLQAEKILLEKKSCLFNVRVITFSMLFNILREELGGDSERPVLDKTSAVLFMWRAVQQVKQDLTWFAGSVNHYSFAEKIFNTVNQLTSSMVDFEKLEANAKAEITRKKMHDIVLIRDAYKNLITNYTDSSGALGWLIENIRHSKVIKAAKVFVAGFSHLSVQRSAVVAELVKYADEFTAGFEKGSEFEQIIAELVLNQSIACKHLYIEGNTPKPLPEVRAFDTVQDEAIWIANEIYRLVRIEGVRFRDIVVAAANYENAVPVLTQVFTENGIAVNVDFAENLLGNPLVQYLKEYLLLAATGSQIHFINIIKNMYSAISAAEEFEQENKALKSGIRGNAVTAVFVKQLAKCKTTRDFTAVLSAISESASAVTDDGIARRKLSELLDIISNVSNDQIISITEFSNMFAALASATKISDIPALSDGVFLADVAEHQPSFTPYVFVAGAVSGAFPTEQADTDILTVQDIENTTACIEPSASLQNARNRAHAEAVMKSAMRKLYISFTGQNPSELIEKLKLSDDITPIASKTFAVHKVLKAIGDGTAFEDMMYYGGVLKSLDLGGMQYFNPSPHLPELKNAEKLFFPEGSSGVTQLDNFRKCPFYHFLENGLRIRVRERNTIAANVIGMIIHKLAEVFTRRIINCGRQNFENFDAEAEMKKSVDVVLGMNDFKFAAAEARNAPVISNLKKEAKLLARELVRRIKESRYFPKFTEMPLQGEIEGVTIRGKADRVDVDEKNCAFIIDYKTGTVDRQSLQLSLYKEFLPKEYTADGASYFSFRRGSFKVIDSSGPADALGAARELVCRIKKGVIQPAPIGQNSCRYCAARVMCQGGEDDPE